MINWPALPYRTAVAVGDGIRDVRAQLIAAMKAAVGTAEFEGLTAANRIVSAEIDRYSEDLQRRGDAVEAGDLSALR